MTVLATVAKIWLPHLAQQGRLGLPPPPADDDGGVPAAAEEECRMAAWLGGWLSSLSPS